MGQKCLKKFKNILNQMKMKIQLIKLLDVVRTVFRKKFIALNVYI